MTAESSCQSHACLDVDHRRRKAEKIRRILARERSLKGLDLLEIGAGSGVISSYFADIVGSDGTVSAVDLVDERVDCKGYDFTLVNDAGLPYADRSFDIVISNHVIEHVGGRNEQMVHLAEIARVLRPTGIAYLAVPNKWRLVEPHFGLWFLSWLPPFLADHYVRVASKGTHYDCRPPGPLKIRSMIRSAGMSYRERSWLAVRLIGEIEGKTIIQRLANSLPLPLLNILSPFYPTMIFILRAV